MNRPEGLRPKPSDFPQVCPRCDRRHTPASWAGLKPMQSPGLAADGIEYLEDRGVWVEWKACHCNGSLTVDLQSHAERLSDARAALAHAEARASLRHAAERLRAHASACACGCGAQDEELAGELERLAS